MADSAVQAITADLIVVLIVPLSLARDPEVRATVSRTQLDRISRLLVSGDAQRARAFSFQMQRFASTAGDISRDLEPALAELLWDVDVPDISRPANGFVDIAPGRVPEELAIHARRMFTLFRALFARAEELDTLLYERFASVDNSRAWTTLANYWISSSLWIKIGGQFRDPRASVTSAIMLLAQALVAAADARGTLVSERILRTEYMLPSLRNQEIKDREDAFGLVDD